MTHRTTTSRGTLISWDLVLFHASLWHCSEGSTHTPLCRPAAEKWVTTASLRLVRRCVRLQWFLATVSTTEQFMSATALLRRGVSAVEQTAAPFCRTALLSSLSVERCSVKEDAIQLSVKPTDGCIASDNVSPASCTAADERRVKHRTLLLSRMISADPMLLRPTPHVPDRARSHNVCDVTI